MAQETDNFLKQRSDLSNKHGEENRNEEDVNYESTESLKGQLVYRLEDVPPWYASIAFGFQVGLQP